MCTQFIVKIGSAAHPELIKEHDKDRILRNDNFILNGCLPIYDSEQWYISARADS